MLISIEALYNILCVFSSLLFIFSLAGLSSQVSAKRGNIYGILGMLIAIIITSLHSSFHQNYFHFFLAFLPATIIGCIISFYVQMTVMPQTVAAFHSFVGLSAILVGIDNYLILNEQNVEIVHLIEIYFGVFIGGITFTGSLVAFGKLYGIIDSSPLVILGVRFCLYDKISGQWDLYILTGVSCLIGIHLIMSIGGADMPVVISMLNSYSGWACSASGFMLENSLLIITGSLVGSSGAILSYIMCKGMNRSFISVILGGFGTEGVLIQPTGDMKLQHQEISVSEVAKTLERADSIIIVPGYGMAVSRCQNELASIVSYLQKIRKKIRFCIHPVAGRLPGHMNVLLAEANIPYDIVEELGSINKDFTSTDLVLAIGCNDIVNPGAQEDPNCVIAGMPVCEVWKASQCIIFKRSFRSGYAGIENMLFYKQNSKMCFGDAKDTLTKIISEFKQPQSIEIVDIGMKEKKEIIKNKVIFKNHKIDITIGIVKERLLDEKRIAIVPNSVEKLLEKGFEVNYEKNSGLLAGFFNEDYLNAGAKIVSKKEAWESNIVIKINPPSKNEIELMKDGSTLISFIFPTFNNELIEFMIKKNLNVLALDKMPRITKAQKMDVLTSQANIRGYCAVMQAIALLPRYFTSQITSAGSSPPARVLIIGCGIAGLTALGISRKFGANVYAFDTRTACREQVESLGGKYLTINIQENGNGIGGYSKEMSNSFLESEKLLFYEQLKYSDVVITTALIPGKKSPILISKEMVSSMKRGSVIVDLGILETSGNCELTIVGKYYCHQPSGVWIIGDSFIESRMAEQSSLLFSNNVCNLLLEYLKNEKMDFNFQDEIINQILIISMGKLRKPLDLQIFKQDDIQNDKKTEILIETTQDIKQDLKKPLIKKENYQPEKKLLIILGNIWKKIDWALKILLILALFFGIGISTTKSFHILFMEFVYGCIIGFYVVWSVTPSLHTPLMSVTNAISGIIVLGSMLELSGSLVQYSTILGIIGVFFASINIVGGFFITYRMLMMFNK